MAAHSKIAASNQEILPKYHSYFDDLPNPTVVDEELCRLKFKTLLVSKDDHPDTIVKFKESLQAAFPNIYTQYFDEFFSTFH